MNTNWKIFNILNLICLVMITGFFVWRFSSDIQPINNSVDVFFYGVLASIWLTVIINCIHNISLTRLLTEGRNLSLSRKIFFWLLLILFAAVVIFYGFLTATEIQRYFYQPDGAYNYQVSLKYFIQIISISIVGIYIVIGQIILFFKIRRSYGQGIKETIEEIGS